MADASTADEVVALYRSFPFSTDEEYQQGLKSILTGGALDGKSEIEQAQISRLSRMFYFNRVTGHSITVKDILSVEETKPSADEPPPSSTDPLQQEAPRTLTFSELRELIEQGKTDGIPNNRIIPDNLNEDAPSQSQAPLRAKPWESVIGCVGSEENSRIGIPGSNQ